MSGDYPSDIPRIEKSDGYPLEIWIFGFGVIKDFKNLRTDPNFGLRSKNPDIRNLNDSE